MLKIREMLSRSDLNFAQVTSSYGGRKLVKMWKNRYNLEKYFGPFLDGLKFVFNGINRTCG